MSGLHGTGRSTSENTEAGFTRAAIGLTEAGMRNRTHQKQERVLKAEIDLTKHKIACSKKDRI